VLVDVIIRQGSNGRTIAIIPGLPDLQVEASDKATALTQLQQRRYIHKILYLQAFHPCY
jgi:hypothetical protein